MIGVISMSSDTIVNKLGCVWEGGTGIDPDGEFCGECSNIHLEVCPRLESKLANKDIQACPFCGHIAGRQSLHTLQFVYETRYKAIVGCVACGGSMIGCGKTPEDAWQTAIANWNTRKSQ